MLDGLKAEREQGITIDVAYRYFTTPHRKFIIADCPGHEQYTRNMATGASTADAAIILIDARHGVLTQTKRHAFIASLLKIRHLIVAVNKMDLLDYSEEKFRKIEEEFGSFTQQLNIPDVRFVPISAIEGENVTQTTGKTPWYQGDHLLSILETLDSSDSRNLRDFRFPVQTVIRPNLDFRGFAGSITSGAIRRGDPVVTLPSFQNSRIKRIVTPDGDLEEAFSPQAVVLELEDEIDISSGDMIVKKGISPISKIGWRPVSSGCLKTPSSRKQIHDSPCGQKYPGADSRTPVRHRRQYTGKPPCDTASSEPCRPYRPGNKFPLVL